MCRSADYGIFLIFANPARTSYYSEKADPIELVNPKVTVKEVSSVVKELEVVVSSEEVARGLEAAYQKIGSKARIKGFRPGKVPRSVLEQHYRQDAESDAVRELVQQSYPMALHEIGIHPIAPPDIRVTSFVPDQGLTYQAILEVPPQFEVKGYVGLNLKKDPIHVTDAEVEQNLKALQERMAQLIPVTDDRKTRAEDVISLSYQTFHNDKPVPGFQGQNYLIELGKGHLFPELESALVGMAPGEKKKVGVTLPPNWADKTLAGKKVVYELELKEIKDKKVPELNDDLAKDLGQFTTLDEVKGKIREDVAQGKEQAAKGKLRRQILEKLVVENDFLVPESMIRIELEDMLKRFEGHLKSQGITMEQAGMTVGDFSAKNRDEAIFRVRGALIFDAVARKENLAVTPEEIDRRIEEMAKHSGQAPAAWKKYFRENQMMGRVEGSLREEKALDFVLSQSKIKVEAP